MHKSDEYLNWIREQPCVVTGMMGETIVAHHVRVGTGGGMGLKPSDYFCVPLDSHQHMLLHQIGERTYWSQRCVSVFNVILELNLEFIKDRGTPSATALSHLHDMIHDYS